MMPELPSEQHQNVGRPIPRILVGEIADCAPVCVKVRRQVANGSAAT
jgi:hypothetical protein